MNNCWYLFIGYVGGFDLYNEDCSKKYFQGNSQDQGVHEHSLMETAYLTSCVGYYTIPGENGQSPTIVE
jgi:hypothetical protein